MERPNSSQIAAACAILKAFGTKHRGTASDTMISQGVYSICSALGGPGEPAAEYAGVVAQATGGDIKVRPMVKRHEDGSWTIGVDNPFGIPAGTYYPESALAALDDLPDEKALGKMKKAELIAQAEAEQLEGQFDDTMTNADLVAAILEARELGSE